MRQRTGTSLYQPDVSTRSDSRRTVPYVTMFTHHAYDYTHYFPVSTTSKLKCHVSHGSFFPQILTLWGKNYEDLNNVIFKKFSGFVDTADLSLTYLFQFISYFQWDFQLVIKLYSIYISILFLTVLLSQCLKSVRV